jgi:hypothetical protein
MTAADIYREYLSTLVSMLFLSLISTRYEEVRFSEGYPSNYREENQASVAKHRGGY